MTREEHGAMVGDGWDPQAIDRLHTYGGSVLAVAKCTNVDRQGISYTVELRVCAPLGLAGDLRLWHRRVPLKDTPRWKRERVNAARAQEAAASRVMKMLRVTT